MRSHVRVIAVVALLSSISPASQGFWSGWGLYVHQGITSAALATPLWAPAGSNTSYAFSQRAIDAINEVHAAVDNPAGYQGSDHFDSEQLVESYRLLVSRRAYLVDVVLSASQPDETVAWVELGRMLHAVQDYYSHSTWVYRGNTDILNFGSYTLGGQMPPSFSSDPAATSSDPVVIGPVCASDGITVTTLPGTKFGPLVSSGYYRTPRVSTDKCNHGSLPASLNQCQHNDPVKDGINLDSGVFGLCQLGDNVNRAWIAYDLAQKETIQFVQSIISQLEGEGNLKGICVLMDIPAVGGSTSGAPCLLRTQTQLTIPTGPTIRVMKPLAINVTVTPADPSISGAKIPSGQVQVQDLNQGLECIAALDVNGRGSCTFTPQYPVFLMLNGQYQGDAYFKVSTGTASVLVLPVPPPSCVGPYLTFYAPNQSCQSWWNPDATGMSATLSFTIGNPAIVSIQGNPQTLPSGYSGPYPPPATYIATWIAGNTAGGTTVQVLATHPDGSKQYYNTWSVTNSY